MRRARCECRYCQSLVPSGNADPEVKDMGIPRVLPKLVAVALIGLALGATTAEARDRCARRVAFRRSPFAEPATPPRALCPPSRTPASEPTAAIPNIEGPITGGSRGAPFISATSFDLADVGYRQQEFFISGTATGYANVGPLESDGRWSVTPASTAEYKTRIIVFRPIDPRDFNGTVAVEWLNVSGGLDAAPDWITGHTEMIREGYAWVGVSAQFVGVEGMSSIAPGLGGLKVSDPQRYGSLHHPGDTFSYDIFSQAGQAVRGAAAIDPLEGLEPDRVIALGESQSAFRLVTYINAIDLRDRVYDGYFVHSRGGGGASLSQDPQPAINVSEVARFRGDLRVPVMLLQTETDLLILGYIPDRQADGPLLRLWEVAGTSHADTYTLGKGFSDAGGDPSVAEVVENASPIPGIIECARPVNSGPQHFVVDAALHALERWVRTGAPPPHAPRLEVAGEDFVLDENGNVLGGIRTNYVDAPIAKLSGLGQTGSGFCFIFGTTELFDQATLDALYPDHASYVAAVEESTDRAVRARFVLAPDADLIIQQAEQSDIGN